MIGIVTMIVIVIAEDQDDTGTGMRVPHHDRSGDTVLCGTEAPLPPGASDTTAAPLVGGIVTTRGGAAGTGQGTGATGGSATGTRTGSRSASGTVSECQMSG